MSAEYQALESLYPVIWGREPFLSHGHVLLPFCICGTQYEVCPGLGKGLCTKPYIKIPYNPLARTVGRGEDVSKFVPDTMTNRLSLPQLLKPKMSGGWKSETRVPACFSLVVDSSLCDFA